MKQLINKILLEWSLRVHDGMPNKDNPLHIVQLRETLSHMKLTEDVTNLIIQNLIEQDEDEQDEEKFYARSKKSDKIVVYTNKDNWESDIKDGSHEKVDREDAEKELKQQDTDEPEQKDEPKPVDYPSTTDYMSSDDTKTTDKPDTSGAISKVNDKRFGVLKKKEIAVEKGYIGEEDAQKVDEFHQDINEFLQNPTKETAEAMVEKYKLSQNASGSKLYLGFIAGDMRKLLGQNNKLVDSVGNTISQFVDLKAKGDVQKRAMDKLQGASKPGLTTVVKSDDPGVQKIFSTPPYDRLEEKFHQVFGPKGEDGQLLRPSSEHSKAYFQQSVNENESLDNTIDALKELEEQGTASPGVRTALEQHKERMKTISEKYDSMSTEERRKAVEESYSQMAREMHESDPDVARGIMKNMAEMALYDSEIAGGDECYMPSAGTFPSGDKLRVDRDGKGKVEKIAAVSVKFGKSGAFYGFPGESTQYQKFHPDEDKRTYMRTRVGHQGHSLGVRDDLIQDQTKFDKLIEESEIDSAIKDSEKLRKKLNEMQQQVDTIRQEITNPNGKYTNKDLVTKRKELEEINKESQTLLKEVIDEEKLIEIMGKKNAKMFMTGGCNAINIISMSAVLKTSNGLSVIEHNHQIINEDGLTSETEEGTTNLKQYGFQFRAFDKRGGGLLTGFIGGEQ